MRDKERTGIRDVSDVPSEVACQVVEWFGDDGRAWLAALPNLTADLATRWRLSLGPVYPNGSHALVVAVTRADGQPAVLKVPMVDEENRAEADALRLYAGEGAVLLYDHDPASGAMLLERLQPGTPIVEHMDRDQAVATASRLLRRLWRPVPPRHRFPVVSDLVTAWAKRLWTARGVAGLPAALMAEAAAAAERLTRPDGPEGLVNRDAHLGNILAAEREPWLLIDPKPLVGERAFDAGWLIRDTLYREAKPTRDTARHCLALVASELGVRRQRVRDWVLVRAAHNAQWTAQSGGDPMPDLMVADLVA